MARAPKLVAMAVAMAVTAAIGLVTRDAQAGGYGAYLEAEFSDASLSRHLPLNGEKVIRDFRSAMGGVGFIYDSNVASDEPLNYRFKVGYRYGQRKWDDTSSVTIGRRQDQEDPDVFSTSFEPTSKSAQGVTFNQTLGYGFLRNRSYRVWAGPTVRLNVDWYGVATDIDAVDVAVGGGPEFGVNYHLNDHLSLSTSLSYNYLYFSEHFETIGADPHIEGSQHLLAFTVSLLFRSEFDRWGE